MTPLASSSIEDEPIAAQRNGAPLRGSALVRTLALAAGAALFVWAIAHPLFRDGEGDLGSAFVVPLAAAVAMVIAGFAAGTEWRKAAGWLALAVIGQAVALQLVRAGMMVAHQHYVPADELLVPRHAPALLFVVVQLTVVTIGLRPQLDGARRLLESWRPWQRWSIAAVFVLTSATLSREVAIYGAELVLASVVQLINLATVALAVAALPRSATERLGDVVDRVFGAPADAPAGGGIDRFALGGAAWVLIVCALLAWFVYEAHPHVPDEVVYLYHARYFAAGLWHLPATPVPDAFNIDLMTYEADRWYSPVPPGWPAALAVGAYFGVPWLVNPVLNALNALLAYALLGHLFDRRTTRLAFVLLCVSPWFLFMGMNFMTHTFTMTCGLAAALAVAHLRRGDSALWAVIGGLAIGMMGTIRPLEGLTIAVLLGLWALGGWPWRPARIGRVALLTLVSILGGALTLPYNAMLAGDPFTFPLMAYTDSVYGAGTNALGFGANRGLGWPGLDPFMGHGAVDVAVNANLNAHGVNVELLGWSAGSLLPIALLLFSGCMRRADRWMLAVVAAIVGVHGLYWFSGGPDFGARYWYVILLPCIALAARGVIVFGERLDTVDAAASGDAAVTMHARRPLGLTRSLAGALMFVLAALVTFMPWRAVDKYFHYRNMRPDVRHLAKAHDFGRSLVLVRGNRHPDYASAAIYNPLDVRADAPVYIWDRDPAITAEALRAYADRDVWILDGPTRTGGDFAVVAGPIPARELLDAGGPPR